MQEIEVVVCPTCNGEGKVDTWSDADSQIRTTCPRCNGSSSYRALKFIDPVTGEESYRKL